MINSRTLISAFLILAAGMHSADVHAKKIKIGLVQTVVENTLAKNEAKFLSFIDEAKEARCHLVVFPENGLFWKEYAIEDPSKSDLDAAIARIGQRCSRENIHVVFGVAYKLSDNGRYHNHCVVFDAQGNRDIFYKKSVDVPQSFDVGGVRCNVTICSDRRFLEYSDLPAVVQRAQVIIDTSGGHGGDDGGEQLPLIRYRPWATRNGAFVVVSNPVHDDTDFMGRSPWGGGSAIIRPDGSVQDGRRYEKDVLIVQEIDSDEATREKAARRRNHPIFKRFWDAGETMLEKGAVRSVAEFTPYVSSEREIRIAAAQMACSSDMSQNINKIHDLIGQAADQGADVVVFPELAVTGTRDEDILAATPSSLEDALAAICHGAKSNKMHVLVGMPFYIEGSRRNCAIVIAADGTIQTKYAQIVANRNALFTAGASTKAMWFQLKGVYAIVTVGDDAHWIEMANLAANRGMCMHFHISYESDSSTEAATLRKQKNLLAVMYAKYGAVVNAADPSCLSNPSLPASGVSMIVSREGGHEQPAPDGIEYYLPYQTSVVRSGGADETLLLATRKTTPVSGRDLRRHWRVRGGESVQSGWNDWMRLGALLMEKDGQ